ncbi:MAG: hypothetical protein HQM15_00170 [Deltaproteobacteria bacterium]|nr:hypothetical protein [Deltaproteobacteria bacterium]
MSMLSRHRKLFRVLLVSVLIFSPLSKSWGAKSVNKKSAPPAPASQVPESKPAESQPSGPKLSELQLSELALTELKISDLDEVVKRTPSIEMYPCSECHSAPTDFNTEKRQLTKEHLNITSIHPKQRVREDPNYWCHNCHNPGQYNQLRLYSGELVSFNESYRICGQCHGIQLDDWKAHMHGHRTGLWNGAGKIDLCTQCHNPHGPYNVEAMKPLPPPPKPAWMLHDQKQKEGEVR